MKNQWKNEVSRFLIIIFAMYVVGHQNKNFQLHRSVNLGVNDWYELFHNEKSDISKQLLASGICWTKFKSSIYIKNVFLFIQCELKDFI